MKIAQCWDDGVHDDVRLVELLRKYNAKASFNLNAGRHHPERHLSFTKGGKDIYRLGLGELRDVYEGFLVANHSLTHPRLHQVEPEAARIDIVEGRDRLEQIFGYPVRGFVYPFGGYNEVVEQLVREAGHVYARTVVNVDNVLPVENAMAFHPSCHFLSPEFWTKFEAVRKEDGVFYFWGHSYEFIDEADWQDFEKKIERLSAAGEWTDLPDLFA